MLIALGSVGICGWAFIRIMPGCVAQADPMSFFSRTFYSVFSLDRMVLAGATVTGLYGGWLFGKFTALSEGAIHGTSGSPCAWSVITA